MHNSGRNYPDAGEYIEQLFPFLGRRGFLAGFARRGVAGGFQLLPDGMLTLKKIAEYAGLLLDELKMKTEKTVHTKRRMGIQKQ